ncbi:class I SAM-dependent DNA methyltransferase [Hamadaea tsunoensis]|uniref:class I SAM-dependent DNA methyltransferase n=1 Tax=Hamadaea tsunoensis TaxID=53368 RepID=UPI00041536D5|nr:class I SAM-dependent methyltransferase [Hamadaea tsunoensis]
MTADWLADTRTSYDTVAADYATIVRGIFGTDAYLRGVLRLFADLTAGGSDGGGPVLDAGCGPGHVTAHLAGLGVDAFGVDLSPGMIEVARRDHPGLRFEVGTMTALDLPAASLAGLLAWWSLVHVPDEALPSIMAEFRRVVRPGGVVLLGFHVGSGSRHKTEGYGGHPMDVHVYRRGIAELSGLLVSAGFTVETEIALQPLSERPGGIVIARS